MIAPRLRILIIAAAAFAALAALVWFLSERYGAQPVTPLPLPPAGEARDAPTQTAPTPAAPESPAAQQASPLLSPSVSPTPTPNVSLAPPATPPAAAPAQAFPQQPPAAGEERLLIPVAGVRPEDLRDTFTDSRSEGRTHNAIDIMAPRNAPVVATADGRVVKLFRSDKGGITVYQLSTDEKRIYYYAHLERYADGLHEGQFARRGETIGYVGDSGNATPGNTHLHFEVMLVTDPKRYWQGTSINPYPLLRGNQ